MKDNPIITTFYVVERLVKDINGNPLWINEGVIERCQTPATLKKAKILYKLLKDTIYHKFSNEKFRICKVIQEKIPY